MKIWGMAIFTILVSTAIYAEPHHQKGHKNKRPPARVGVTVNVLPDRYQVARYRNQEFFFKSGVYYRKHKAGFIVVRAPVGLRVTSLPLGYKRLVLRGKPYFYFNSVYYVKDGGDYLIVANPDELVGDNKPQGASQKLLVYPQNNQPPSQIRKDKYECMEWAVEQTQEDALDVETASENYQTSYLLCLSARGYSRTND